MNEIRRAELQRILNTKGMEEFDKACAYEMMDTITELHHRPLPTMPDQLKDYMAKKRDDFEYTVHPSFFKQPHIVSYMKDVSEVECYNTADLYWLRFMKKNIPSDETAAHERIDKQLATFGIYFNQPPSIGNARRIFSPDDGRVPF